jgi:hypothetical protein
MPTAPHQGKPKGATHHDHHSHRDHHLQSLVSASRPRQQTGKEAITANVQLLIEQLEAGHSDALTAYLTAMGRFHQYSFGNILEIGGVGKRGR